MVSINQALKLIDSQVKLSARENVVLTEMVGRILAEPLYAPLDLPPFRQSAMDGYAINYLPDQKHYTIKGEIAAGSSDTFELKPGEAVRIFTGACTPHSANAVVMQENCIALDSLLTLQDEVKLFQHIRNQGDQIKKNSLALESGTLLNPAAVGFISALGIETVNVYRKPKIAIIATGSELIKPGNLLSAGKIYESNSYMLQAAIDYYRVGESEIFSVHDDLEATKSKLLEVMNRADFVLLSGGISAGEYDFVAQALNEIGVEGVFHKVRQKPGKPLYFGVEKNNRYVFALPGNPSAAMTSFLIYVLPALKKFAGGGFNGLQKIRGKIQTAYKKNDDRTHLLKAHTDEHSVRILDGQNSDILMSFIHANSIALIPEGSQTIDIDQSLEVFLL
ncbi:MAG: molybdopterin molybdotransferase MoeA [Crocinitomix sp.]|jgi:molybdopterin molybdotransferase|nr:molybdopterin molybdotransferase MoeA [Crocinitomix sp.]